MPASTHHANHVRAAGGVPWRTASSGEIEVLVVSRVLQQDWSFPKGKCDPGESDQECAVREVEEETGVRCRLGAELATARYTDRFGRPKQVRYWAMTVVGPGRYAGDGEIAAVEWLRADAAGERLSYASDRALLRAVLAGLSDVRTAD